MFGSKEKKISRLIQKGKWEELNKKFLNSDTETKIMLAQECSKATDPGVNSILTTLIRDSDKRVQLAAVKSIAMTGKDHEVAQLQWLLSNTPEENKELIAAVQEAISKVRGRR
jgi:hypothetical protein